MRSSTVWLTAAGAALAATMIGALSIHVPGADTVGSQARANVFVGVLAIGLLIYLLAVRLVLRTQLSPAAFWIVLAVAVIMRAVLLPAPPFLSSDIYRYVWDGQVQGAGINPYRYVPADPALAGLRDPDAYPLINRKDYAHTIYLPAAQIVFAIVGRLSATATGMKAAMLGFELAASICLLKLLALAGLPRERILIYLWNPLPLWSFACDGHVDAITAGLLGLALLARARHRDGLGGALLAAATLVKVLPIVVVPAFVRGGRLWRPALAGAAVVIALYLPYLSAGHDLVGFVSTYGGEEGYDTGTGYWLLAGLAHVFTLPAWASRAYTTCVAIGFAALAIRVARGRPADATPDTIALCRDTAVLAACATVASNPHYAWYYAWLSVPCVIAPVRAVIWLSAAPVLFYIDPFDERFFWPALVFVPAIALAAHAIRQSRRHALVAVTT